MKKHSIIALVLLGVISLGCVREEIPGQARDDGEGSTGDPVTLTTTITLPDDPGTKALTAAGVKTFAPGDEVAVVYACWVTESEWWTGYFSELAKATLSAEDISNDGKSAKISVSMNQILPDGKVRIIYPANMLNLGGYEYNAPDDDNNINYDALATQDGTLASLASNLDLAVYDGRREGGELPGNIQLENRLAIGEFTVKDDSSNDITSSITSFTVSDDTDTYTVSRAAGPGPIYVAMKPVSNGNLTLSATDASNGYEKTVTGKTLEANKMYPIGVTMPKSFDARVTPLTFEAIEAGTVTYTPADASFTIQYSKNGGAWTEYGSAIGLSAGDKVAFRGKNATYRTSSDYSQFVCSADCYLYGNIMSLVTDYSSDANAFASNVTLTAAETFFRMFDDNSNQHIKSHASKPIVLPATTLTEVCYCYLFSNTGLTSAPVLPATTLTGECYEGMFAGCASLTAAPALPATVLETSCYDSMFSDCASLTAAPALPATTLAAGCYMYMFYNCASLASAPALPATTLASNCYFNMFYGCTGLTTAPILPATRLESACYQSMFYGCSQLNSVTCYAVDISAEYCTANWLDGVPASGTFRIHPTVNTNDIASCIPNGWTVERYPVATKALSQASWEDVGRVIGADGNIYTSAAQATTAGTKPEAVIAFVGSIEGVCSHGLALALVDASSSATFYEATGESLIPGWAASHSVPGGTWRLPSVKDWQYLTTGNYDANTMIPFKTCIDRVLSNVGGSSIGLQLYWSSTSKDDTSAWLADCHQSGEINFFIISKDDVDSVRACLSF